MVDREENNGEIQLLKMQLFPDDNGLTLTLYGQSLAATRTSITVAEFGLVFDFGFCSLMGTRQEMVLITHGHADHIGSLHFHAFERKMHGMSKPTYLMPGVCRSYFDKSFLNFQAIGGGKKADNPEQYYQSMGVNLDQLDIPLISTPKGRAVIKAYQMRHAVPALGYVIFDQRKRLKPIYQNLDRYEISKLARMGEKVNQTYELPILAFTGDTTFRAILENPIFFQVKTLIIECTFLGLNETETPSFAKKRGHIHLQNFYDHLEKFQNKMIVLCHFSRRYKREIILIKTEELNKAFGDRCQVRAFI